MRHCEWGVRVHQQYIGTIPFASWRHSDVVASLFRNTGQVQKGQRKGSSSLTLDFSGGWRKGSRDRTCFNSRGKLRFTVGLSCEEAIWRQIKEKVPFPVANPSRLLGFGKEGGFSCHNGNLLMNKPRGGWGHTWFLERCWKLSTAILLIPVVVRKWNAPI